jgi:hypothetical protein
MWHTLNIRHLQVRVFQSRRGHHYGETWQRSSPLCKRAQKTDMSRPWLEPTTSCAAGEHSSKEILQQLMLQYLCNFLCREAVPATYSGGQGGSRAVHLRPGVGGAVSLSHCGPWGGLLGDRQGNRLTDRQEKTDRLSRTQKREQLSHCGPWGGLLGDRQGNWFTDKE